MYCTYITTYIGNKLPRWYIGSTSVTKITDGYHGTVLSKKYKVTWKEELIEHPELFSTEIIKEYDTRQEAIDAEYELHVACNVVKSTDYVNMARATVNGFFGMECRGADHPNTGRVRSKENREKISRTLQGNQNAKGSVRTKENREAISRALTGRKLSPEHVAKYRQRQLSPETKEKLRISGIEAWKIRKLTIEQRE